MGGGPLGIAAETGFFVGRPALGTARQCLQVLRGLLDLNRPHQAFSRVHGLKLRFHRSRGNEAPFFYLNPQPRSPKSKRSHQRRGLRTWPNRIQLLINMNAAGDSVNALITHGSWILLRLLFDYHISKLKVNVRLARQSAATSACPPPRIQRAFPNSPIKSSTTQFARAACNLSAAAPCCQTA